MNRDEDDEIELPALKLKPGPIADKYKFVDRKGRFTDEGKIALMHFRNDCLVPDDECSLEREDLERAFEAYPAGFSLADLDDYETFDEFICTRGASVLLPGADRSKPESFAVQIISKRKEVYGARFVDALGFEAFDPTENESTAVEYLVDTLLPRRGVHMFVAMPETLKTWLAYHVAICVSQGRPVLGRFAAVQGRAVIIDFEMGSVWVRHRLRLLGADGRIFCKSFPPYRLNDENDRFWIELQKLQPRFVVIDGLGAGQSAGVGELDSRFAEPLGRAARFAEEHNCTLLFLHHSPKAASVSDVESLFRGTGAIRSKVDAGFYFQRLPSGPNDEARAKIMTVKWRKAAEKDRPPPFAIQLTNERGVEFFEGTTDPKPVPLTDEDKVLAMIKADDTVSGNQIAKELEMRRERVSEILDGLEKAGRIHIEGKGRSTSYVVVEESFPVSLPLERLGSETGNDVIEASNKSPESLEIRKD